MSNDANVRLAEVAGAVIYRVQGGGIPQRS